MKTQTGNKNTKKEYKTSQKTIVKFSTQVEQKRRTGGRLIDAWMVFVDKKSLENIREKYVLTKLENLYSQNHISETSTISLTL